MLLLNYHPPILLLTYCYAQARPNAIEKCASIGKPKDERTCVEEICVARARADP